MNLAPGTSLGHSTVVNRHDEVRILLDVAGFAELIQFDAVLDIDARFQLCPEHDRQLGDAFVGAEAGREGAAGGGRRRRVADQQGAKNVR